MNGMKVTKYNDDSRKCNDGHVSSNHSYIITEGKIIIIIIILIECWGIKTPVRFLLLFVPTVGRFTLSICIAYHYHGK